MRRLIRETAFNMARHDLAAFLRDHEEQLLVIFREELQALDDEIPEENFFIDLNMVGIGETVLRATLYAMQRFLLEDPPPPPQAEAEAIADTVETANP